jgi:hypothetical protein
MKFPLTALALAALAASTYANDSDSSSSSSTGNLLVPSGHGGYNVVQGSALPQSTALFGPHGSTSNNFLVPSPHGGYNVVQGKGLPESMPFFGSNGYARNAVEIDKATPKKFVLQPMVIDDGHGKHTVYKKVYFATAEEAAASREKVQSGGY